jgi:hypothetical protein
MVFIFGQVTAETYLHTTQIERNLPSKEPGHKASVFSGNFEVPSIRNSSTCAEKTLSAKENV